MGAVFGEISKGSSVTAGLKKVEKSQMTHKNPELRNLPPVEVKKAAAPKAAAPKAAGGKAKGEAKVHEARGTWFVENFDNNNNIEIPDVEVKQSVYIVRCDNSTITIPRKVKSIQVDSCSKTRIVFNSVVSTFECFNSQRVDIECTVTAPSIALDKCSGIVVQMLSDEGKRNPPQIVTSNISECNFTVTGKKPDDDPVEIPLPEQYISIYDPKTGKINTQPTNHGD
jgi:adenylyl cyclase-associated protein